MVTMAICGDLVPTRSNAPFFERGEVSGALDERLIFLLMTADARVINLEAPLFDGSAPIKKAGPALSAPTGCTKGLGQLSPILALANNHILDHGPEGLNSTLGALNAAGIPAFGAGSSLSLASKPYIYIKDGLRIGLIACCEREFSVAGENSPGANPFDPLETPDQVQRLKASCDHVVVLYHGGIECYRYPSPGLRKALRKLVEKGADLVVCQHTHAVGCFEEYEGGTIVYGQGNLLFDRRSDEFWRTALVVQATFGGGVHVQYLPVVHQGHRALMAKGDERTPFSPAFTSARRKSSPPASSRSPLAAGRSRRWRARCTRSPERIGC